MSLPLFEPACSHFFIPDPWSPDEEFCLYCGKPKPVAPEDVIVPWVAPPEVRIEPPHPPELTPPPPRRIDWRARHRAYSRGGRG